MKTDIKIEEELPLLFQGHLIIYFLRLLHCSRTPFYYLHRTEAAATYVNMRRLEF